MFGFSKLEQRVKDLERQYGDLLSGITGVPQAEKLMALRAKHGLSKWDWSISQNKFSQVNTRPRMTIYDLYDVVLYKSYSDLYQDTLREIGSQCLNKHKKAK